MQYEYAHCIQSWPQPPRTTMTERTAPGVPLKPTHHMILLLLAEEPTYGVELMQRLDERSGGAIRLNPGSLYRTIARLVDEGLAEPLEKAAPAEGGGAPRKIYGVTGRGLAALRAEARRQATLLDTARDLDLLEDPR
jgi:DNA-binding PadR family transcriptional regulator